MNPTLSNAIYLAGIPDLSYVEQSQADQLIYVCLSNIYPDDLTDADKRLVLTLLKSRPTKSEDDGQKLEDFLSPIQVAQLQALGTNT